jgi:hypothetical protein
MPGGNQMAHLLPQTVQAQTVQAVASYDPCIVSLCFISIQMFLDFYSHQHGDLGGAFSFSLFSVGDGIVNT